MGCDAFNVFLSSTRPVDVEEFLEILGFSRIPRWVERGPLIIPDASHYSLFEDDHYRMRTGLLAQVYKDEGDVIVHTRTTIWRSRFDTDLHNKTIRQLRKRFGGHFVSDFGKNRYFKNSERYIEKAEAGCYHAFTYFHANWRTADTHLRALGEVDFAWPELGQNSLIDANNPAVVSANLAVPFLVSMLEDYYRTTFTALLRYSEQRQAVFKRANLSGEDLASISDGLVTVEAAVTRWFSFQDVDKVVQFFARVDPSLDVSAPLKKPYRRRKESILGTVARLVAFRHLLVHEALVDHQYDIKRAIKDLNTIRVGVERVYRYIASRYGWLLDHPELRSTG